MIDSLTLSQDFNVYPGLALNSLCMYPMLTWNLQCSTCHSLLNAEITGILQQNQLLILFLWERNYLSPNFSHVSVSWGYLNGSISIYWHCCSYISGPLRWTLGNRSKTDIIEMDHIDFLSASFIWLFLNEFFFWITAVKWTYSLNFLMISQTHSVYKNQYI